MKASNEHDIYNIPEIVKLIYFNLKTAYLKRNQKDIDVYISALKKVSPISLEISLSNKQLSDLANIAYSIKNKIYYHEDNILDECPKPITSYDSQLLFEEEKYLKQKICSEFHLVNDLLNKEMWIHNVEHRTKYGFIDILAKQDRKISIIELKKDIAKHDIIGQILKYILCFQEKLIYNLWDEVNAICIAGNYTEFTYNELKKLGVETLIYKYKNGSLELSKI